MEFFAEGFQAGYPFGFNAVLHLVFPFGGTGTGTAGVGEYVDEGRADAFLQEVVSFLEQFFRLSWQAYYYIDAEEYQRLSGTLQRMADVVDAGGEQGGVVPPANSPQECVAAALQRNVEMPLEFGSGGNPVHNFWRNQVGLNGRNPVPVNAFHLIQRLEQIQKTFSGGTSKISGVYPREHHLPNLLRSYLPGLFYRFAHRNIPAPAPGIRHRAICTEVVTSILNLQETSRSFPTAICAKSCGGCPAY